MTLNWLTYFPSPARGVWHLGPVPIRAYALCIIIGIVIALLIGDRRWRARGGEPGVIYDIALWAVPFGLIGGRLYHLMTDWRTYFGEGGVGWEATPRIWDGGLGIWGAVALGGVGAWIGCRRRRIPLPAFGDAVAPGIVLAQAIGRLGNYFNQELYGRETTLPWGLEIFWREDAAGVRDPHLLDGVSTGELYKIVQPTFLYELLWNLVVFAVLIYADRRFRMGHGRLFALYVAGYCIGRFGIELLRDDAATHIAGIRVNSFTSTFVFIGAVVYILLATKGREDPDAIRRAWEQDESAQQPAAVETEPESEDEKQLVVLGAANGVGSVVRVPRLMGEAETESAEAETETDDDVIDEDVIDESEVSEDTEAVASTDGDENTGAATEADEDVVTADALDVDEDVEAEAATDEHSDVGGAVDETAADDDDVTDAEVAEPLEPEPEADAQVDADDDSAVTDSVHEDTADTEDTAERSDGSEDDSDDDSPGDSDPDADGDSPDDAEQR